MPRAGTKYAVIFNPVAGKGKAGKKARELADQLRVHASLELRETTGKGSAMAIARDCASVVDRIVAVGGDGTLNEVLNGILEAGSTGVPQPILSYLPAGTGNAAALALGAHFQPRVAAQALRVGVSQPLDVGWLHHQEGKRAFILWLGAGWDAVLIHALDASRNGKMGLLGVLVCCVPCRQSFAPCKTIRSLSWNPSWTINRSVPSLPSLSPM